MRPFSSARLRMEAPRYEPRLSGKRVMTWKWVVVALEFMSEIYTIWAVFASIKVVKCARFFVQLMPAAARGSTHQFSQNETDETSSLHYVAIFRDLI